MEGENLSREVVRPPNAFSRHPTSHRLEFGTEFAVDVKHRVVIVKFGKSLKREDIEHYVQQLRANASFDPTFSEIVDLTRVEGVSLSGEDILRLADHIDPFSSGSYRAFITKDAAQTHLARMYQISRMAGDKIRSFPSMEEAEKWIQSVGK